MAGSSPGISVVIPSYEGWPLLQTNLPFVCEACSESEGETEIVVAEDAGNDGTASLLAEHYPEVRVVIGETNLGFSGNANRGVQAARLDKVFLLNNDAQPQSDLLDPLAAALEPPDVFAVQCMALDGPEGAVVDAAKAAVWRRGSWRTNHDLQPSGDGPHLSFFASGGFSAFDRAKFLELGGFDELFNPFNYEDVDLSYRAWKRGWRVLFEPRSIVTHRRNTTISRHYTDRAVRVISRRNRMLLHWKNIHDRRMLAAHLAWSLTGTLGSTLVGRWSETQALGRALALLPEVLRGRAVERRKLAVRDGVLRRNLRPTIGFESHYQPDRQDQDESFR